MTEVLRILIDRQLEPFSFTPVMGVIIALLILIAYTYWAVAPLTVFFTLRSIYRKILTKVPTTKLLLLLSPFLISSLVIFIALIYSDGFTRGIVRSQLAWKEKHDKEVLYVFTNLFPRATGACKNAPAQSGLSVNESSCDARLRTEFDKLDKMLRYEGSTLRQPLYFIRLDSQNNIEKLFQSGLYIREKVDTIRERHVVALLQGKRDPYPFPQYHCYGGNDPWCDMPLINVLLPTRHYLQDFMTEIELIHPVKNELNEIIGAVVILYGD